MKSHGYCVYMHTAPNGKVYIGKTKRKPSYRWNGGKGYIHNKHFYNAILKYGWNNIKHEILEEGLTEEEAYQSEIDYIAMYNSSDKRYGYNITKGGDGGLGLKRDPKAVKRTALLASEANKGRFTGGKSARAKVVVQYTKDGQFIREWNATTEAADAVGANYTGIVKCCTKSYKTCKDFLWFYKGEDTEEAIAEAVERAAHIQFAPNQNENRLKALREHYAKLKEEKERNQWTTNQ